MFPEDIPNGLPPIRGTEHQIDFIPGADTATLQVQPSSSKEPLELPQGPITRSRAKQFKEAISALVDQVWGETLVGRIDEAWTNSMSLPCTLLRAELSSTSAH